MDLGSLRNNFKNTLLYIFFEGLSRGGTHILLLYVAIFMEEQIYLSLLLLISLETFLPVLHLTNYPSVLFRIGKQFDRDNLFSTILSFSFLSGGIQLVFIFLLFEDIAVYFQYAGFYVYLLILFNATSSVYFRFISFYFQVEENHAFAVSLKSLPFFLSSSFAILAVIFLEDKVIAFFIGKSVGFVLTFLYLTIKRKLIQFKLILNRSILKTFISRVKYLFLVGFLGWLSGYGIMNLAKGVLEEASLVEFGYLLNTWMIFLLVANGVNSVYEPMLKRYHDESPRNSARLQKKYQFIYIAISLLFYCLYLILSGFSLPERAGQLLEALPFACLIFVGQSLYYLTVPYYYFEDKFKKLAKIIIISDFVSYALLILLLTSGGSEYFTFGYIGVLVIRSINVYINARK